MAVLGHILIKKTGGRDGLPVFLYTISLRLLHFLILALYSSNILISISFGSTRLRNTDTTNTTATTFAENTDCTSSGKISHMPISLAVVKPMPTARERETIALGEAAF